MDSEDFVNPQLLESTSVTTLNPHVASVWNKDSLLDTPLASFPVSTFKPEMLAWRFHLVKVPTPHNFGKVLTEEKNSSCLGLIRN